MGTGDIVHIALAANHRYMPGLRATMISMINAATEPERLNFHVFSDGLTAEDEQEIQAIADRKGSKVEFLHPDMTDIENRFTKYNGSHTTFLRLFFPELLKDLDWVIWSDVDTLWFKDPAMLWRMQDDEKSLLWVRDMPSTRRWGKRIAKWRPDRDEKHYACAGVMLMNLELLRKKDLVGKSVDFVKRWGTPLFVDQDILNEICYDDCRFIDETWDCFYPVKNINHGLVLHFNGLGPHFNDGKFKGWFPQFEIWFRYYMEIVEGRHGAPVASGLKRLVYGMVALLHPIQRYFAPITFRIHPWVSDYIQRWIFFSWLRRKQLWQAK